MKFSQLETVNVPMCSEQAASFTVLYEFMNTTYWFMRVGWGCSLHYVQYLAYLALFFTPYHLGWGS